MGAYNSKYVVFLRLLCPQLLRTCLFLKMSHPGWTKLLSGTDGVGLLLLEQLVWTEIKDQLKEYSSGQPNVSSNRSKVVKG